MRIKWNTELFIQRGKELYGDKYDYSITVFKGLKEYIKIICPIHGEIELIARNHFKNEGCRLCSNKKSGKLKNEKSKRRFI